MPNADQPSTMMRPQDAGSVQAPRSGCPFPNEILFQIFDNFLPEWFEWEDNEMPGQGSWDGEAAWASGGFTPTCPPICDRRQHEYQTLLALSRVNRHFNDVAQPRLLRVIRLSSVNQLVSLLVLLVRQPELGKFVEFFQFVMAPASRWRNIDRCREITDRLHEITTTHLLSDTINEESRCAIQAANTPRSTPVRLKSFPSTQEVLAAVLGYTTSIRLLRLEGTETLNRLWDIRALAIKSGSTTQPCPHLEKVEILFEVLKGSTRIADLQLRLSHPSRPFLGRVRILIDGITEVSFRSLPAGSANEPNLGALNMTVSAYKAKPGRHAGGMFHKQRRCHPKNILRLEPNLETLTFSVGFVRKADVIDMSRLGKLKKLVTTWEAMPTSNSSGEPGSPLWWATTVASLPTSIEEVIIVTWFQGMDNWERAWWRRDEVVKLHVKKIKDYAFGVLYLKMPLLPGTAAPWIPHLRKLTFLEYPRLPRPGYSVDFAILQRLLAAYGVEFSVRYGSGPQDCYL